MNDLESKIQSMIKPLSIDLYDTETTQEHGKYIYRVYITSKEGVNLDKCEEVSKMISPLLDVQSPMHNEYFFEVSSPGIERKLTKLRHFESAIGEKVKIKLKDVTKLSGTLTSVEDGSITIQTEEEPVTFHFDDVKTAKTYFDWEN